MKILKLILIIILLLQFASCYSPCFYSQTKEKNKNGISKKHQSWRLKTLKPKTYGSYAADEKYVKNVELFCLNDTISKRCFKSYEMENLKKVFLRDTLFSKDALISIRSYRRIDLIQCVGLFYASFVNIIDGGYITIPFIRLNDTILANGISGIEADSNTQKYIEKNLLEVYDSVETKRRVDIFMRGRFNERFNKGQRVKD